MEESVRVNMDIRGLWGGGGVMGIWNMDVRFLDTFGFDMPTCEVIL